MKNKILTVAALAMVFASCQKNEDTEKVVSQYISVDAGMGSLARATSEAFEDGDQISIYAWAGADLETAVAAPLIVSNSINTLSGTKWNAAPQMLWKDMTTPHYFVSTYPTQVVADFKAYEFTLTGVELHDDLLFATNMLEHKGADADNVKLVFSHSQSNIIVNLSLRDQFGGTPTVTSVTVFAKDIASIDFLTQTTTVASSAVSSELAIAEITENTQYKSVVVPQTINKITITIDGKNYIYNNQEGIALVQGKTQTISLNVGRNSVVLGDVTITDWLPGVVIGDGDAEAEEE